MHKKHERYIVSASGGRKRLKSSIQNKISEQALMRNQGEIPQNHAEERTAKHQNNRAIASRRAFSLDKPIIGRHSPQHPPTCHRCQLIFLGRASQLTCYIKKKNLLSGVSDIVTSVKQYQVGFRCSRRQATASSRSVDYCTRSFRQPFRIRILSYGSSEPLVQASQSGPSPAAAYHKRKPRVSHLRVWCRRYDVYRMVSWIKVSFPGWAGCKTSTRPIIPGKALRFTLLSVKQ